MRDAAVLSTESLRKPSRLRSSRVRNTLNELMLYHLLENLLVVRAHVVDFREIVNKLLA